jgi:hypothetical protein
MWEFERTHGALPDGSAAQTEELKHLADEIWSQLGINPKGAKSMDTEIIQ